MTAHSYYEPQSNLPITEMCIDRYLHCARCYRDLPRGVAPNAWARLSIGVTPIGLQVWCERHACNVAHLDFDGMVLRANVGTASGSAHQDIGPSVHAPCTGCAMHPTGPHG